MPVEQDPVEQSIQWMIRLRFNTPDEATRQAFEQWLAASSRHQEAWQRLESLGQDFQQLPRSVAMQTLGSQGHQRRRHLKLLGLLGLGTASMGLVVHQSRPHAQYVTGTGERLPLQLADGSKALLNTGTALDTDFNAEQRRIRLHQGEVWLDTRQAAQPLRIETPHGILHTDQSRVIVRSYPQHTRLWLEQGTLSLLDPLGAARHSALPGQYLAFTHDSWKTLSTSPFDPRGWLDDVIVARKMRLDDFLDELARYRPGWLGCSAEVAAREVSGIYRTTDSDKTLALLGSSLSLDVLQLSRYWTRLSLRS